MDADCRMQIYVASTLGVPMHKLVSKTKRICGGFGGSSSRHHKLLVGSRCTFLLCCAGVHGHQQYHTPWSLYIRYTCHSSSLMRFAYFYVCCMLCCMQIYVASTLGVKMHKLVSKTKRIGGGFVGSPSRRHKLLVSTMCTFCCAGAGVDGH
jgi:xanthine dehydrogenase molybdopterin-binding subunit B